MNGRPVLVVGRSGQLACCFYEMIKERDAPIVLMGRPDLDLENAASVERAVDAVQPAAIVNAAAYTAVDQAEDDPLRAFRVNRDGAASLAVAAQRRDIPFIHISTDYVFDGEKQSPYREDDNTAPINVYGRSKLEGEEAVLDACPRAVVIRTSWIYSPYGHNFLRTMWRLSLSNCTVKVVDDQRGTPTSALDLAAAIMSIVWRLTIDRSGDVGGIYHLTAQGETTWYSFAAEIFAGLTRRGGVVPALEPIATDQYPTPALRPKYSCLDCSKAERVFGIRLAPWRNSLDTCLDQLTSRKVLTPC